MIHQLENYLTKSYPLLEIAPGDWYNTDKIDKTIKNINEKTSELGYAFVEVIPKIRKLKNTSKVNIISV